MDLELGWTGTGFRGKLSLPQKEEILSEGSVLGWSEGGEGQTLDFSVNSLLFTYNTQLPANDESPEAKWAGIHWADCSAAIRRLQQAGPDVSTPHTDFLRATRYSRSCQETHS